MLLNFKSRYMFAKSKYDKAGGDQLLSMCTAWNLILSTNIYAYNIFLPIASKSCTYFETHRF